MEKCDKRRGKYATAQANSMMAKYRNSADNETENRRKCRTGNDASMAHERSERRQSNPAVDSNANYCCSVESYRPRKHHDSPSASRTKYQVPSIPEETYRAECKNLGNLRTFRKQMFLNNVAIVRKNRYKDELDEDEDSKYVDEDLELTGDENVEEENREDVADENCEDASEFNDKDYEEQEADDEVDEESDALERQVDRLRIQRKTRIEPPPRSNQKISSVEPSQHHRGLKTVAGRIPARCCRSVAERDTVDIPTEEEEEEPRIREPETLPSRKSSWRCPPPHQERDTWNRSRNLMERYEDLNRASLGSAHLIRRPRTTRAEAVETSMRSGQLETLRNQKCVRCASGHTPKTTSSRNASCRLHDSRYFMREPRGDECEDYEEPGPPMIYHPKSRKSKEARSPIYDSREDARNFDAEIGAIYKTCGTKNPRETPSGYRERTKHSVRANNRHDSMSATMKHDDRYWS